MIEELQQLKIKKPRKNNNISKETYSLISNKEQLENILEDCSSLRKLAKKLDISYNVLIRWAEYHGIDLPTKEDMAVAKFYENISKDINGCWTWNGKETIRFKGKSLNPLKFALKEITGINSKPKNLKCTCNNESCINPHHYQVIR